MRASLRPMTLGEILDRTFQIFKTRFWTFVVIAAAPALVIIALEAINRFWWGLTPEPFRGNFRVALLQGSLYIVAIYQVALPLHLLVWPAFSCLSSKLFLGEDQGLTGTAFRGNVGWGSWLWMAASIWGIVLILPELVLSGVFLGLAYIVEEVAKASASVEDWLMPSAICAEFAIGCVVFFWLSSALFFAIPVRSQEGLTVGKALRRSWRLSRGRRLKTIVVRCSLFFIAWLLNILLLGLTAVIIGTIARSLGAWLPYSRYIFSGLGFFSAFVVSTLFGPIFPIALTLFYYDQRIRLEGYDIERMMEAAGLNAPATSPAGEGAAVPAEAVEGQA